MVAGVQRKTELFKTLETNTADIAILGVWEDNKNKCEAVARKIRKLYPEMKIVAFARDNTHSIITKMLEAGIHAVISNAKFDYEKIEDLLEKIVNNEKYITPIELYDKRDRLKGEFLPEIPEKWKSENLTIEDQNAPTIPIFVPVAPISVRPKRLRIPQKDYLIKRL